MPRIIVLLTALISLCGADEAEDRWPLIFAAGEGDAAAVERLLAAGADVHQLSADGETALHVSAIKGDLRTAQLLLDAGAEVDARTPRGSTIYMTPTMWTVYHGHVELMELLLDTGADASAADEHGKTLLEVSRRPGNRGSGR